MTFKQCRVCGDKALSFNFNAISCESCKAFFRRHATKNKVLKCPFLNNCEINTITRRFCQKCRLKKCFEIEKRRKIQLNRDKSNASSSSLTSADQLNQSLSEESSSTSTVCESAINDSCIQIALQTEFHPTSLENNPKTETNSTNEFNSKEMSRIQELFVASMFLEEPLDPKTSNPSNLISLINLTDLAVKRIIKMTRGIVAFNSLCQEDRIALLKGGCSELMMLRSIKNFDADKNSWRLPTGCDGSKELTCDMKVLKEASLLGLKLYKEYQKFVLSFNPKWRWNETIILLLSAIIIFSPQRANIVHKNVIKLEQETYYYLLKRYLENFYKGRRCEARSAFLSLIERLQDLHRLSETHLQVYLEVDQNYMEPLLIEIFDLNPKIKNNSKIFTDLTSSSNSN
ncbi:NR1IN [Lepeophtheirus salmonis]|uniref:NR1IN n=1 Tax=Lepeophtheirus salmonis TaxID=72036 RepID=A0A7R8H3D5_LEPSM|nr:NR1IN [Lepeophtheirus salmonis]CAF2844292.1 NR1IN [Lepeophtheirus salmonis]